MLEDEADVAASLTPASVAMVAYRRLRTRFESAHLYDEAEDCVWGAMEMRRLDKTVGVFNRLALNGYRFASCYGSSFARALFVLLAAVLLVLPLGAATSGLTPTPEAQSIERQVREWGSRHQHSLIENPSDHVLLALRDELTDGSRLYARALVYTLQVSTFQDKVDYEPVAVSGHILAAVARAVVPAQVALLLLALRRRFSQ